MSLTPEQCENFWTVADKDGNGCLDVHELAKALREYKPDVTDQEITTMFLGLDHSEDKKITKAEFTAEMNQKPKRSETLLNLFNQHDASGDGALSRDELKPLIVQCFNPEVVDEVLKEFFEYCDASGDGKVSFEEFKIFFG